MNAEDTPRDTVRITVDAEDLPRGQTDWEHVDALTDEEVERTALADPDAQPVPPEELADFHPVVDVKRIRTKFRLSQREFAQTFRIPVRTLQDWEQHRSRPDTASRLFLRVIDREPEAVKRALADI